MSNLELWLDSYNDIYSDFDSRHYSKRRISEDFIQKLRLGLKHKEEFITDIVFKLSAPQRDAATEPLIKESLHSFFTGKYYAFDGVLRKKKWSAWMLLLGGIVVMGIDAVISNRLTNSIALQFLRVLLQPAGWFFLWTAMQSLFYDLKKLAEERKFLAELAAVRYHFHSADN